jgi:hypothetical protein
VDLNATDRVSVHPTLLRHQWPEIPFNHRLPYKFLIKPLRARQPHLAPQRFVIEQPGDLAGEINGVAGFAQETGDSISDRYGNPPMRLAMTGVLLAIASTDVRLNAS